MKRDRKSHKFVLLILLASVFTFSLGFAAYSSTLIINPVARVNPDPSTFRVVFSSSDQSVVTDPVEPMRCTATSSFCQSNSASLTFPISNASIENGTSPTISGFSATFDEVGEQISYKFYAHNTGEFDAYLTNIAFANVSSESSKKVCTAKIGTDATQAETACAHMLLQVDFGDASAGNFVTFNQTDTNETITSTISNANGNNDALVIPKNSYRTVYITVKYEDNSDVLDGDVSVDFGDITFSYSTTEPS